MVHFPDAVVALTFAPCFRRSWTSSRSLARIAASSGVGCPSSLSSMRSRSSRSSASRQFSRRYVSMDPRALRTARPTTLVPTNSVASSSSSSSSHPASMRNLKSMASGSAHTRA
eukprot:Amastigsp_a3589_4.p2 type:complete len:114 gc:universal Amastigsp_a3589_4:273-614(+)